MRIWCALHSTGLNHWVKQVAHCDVVPQDLTLDAVDLALLFLDLLFKIGQLVLQRLDELLSNFLLFFQALGAVNSLFTPVFVLFGHAFNIVSHVVDRFSERVCGLAQDLNCLLHELDVVLVKSAALATAWLLNWSWNLLGVIFACRSSRSLSCGRFRRFLFTDFTHLNLRCSVVLTTTSRRLIVIVISHELFCLFD